MLFTFLDNLRQKPKHVRDQYAFGIAVFCTLLIGGVWSLSLPARFGGDSQVAALASTTNAAPFANFFTQLKNQFSGFTEVINEFPASTSTPTSIASSTEAALDFKLTDETKEQVLASSTGTKIEFGTGVRSSTTNESTGTPVLIGTTSATALPAR
jgi:hypothetical protein